MDDFDIFGDTPVAEEEAPVVEPTPQEIVVALDEEEHKIFPATPDLYETGNRVLTARAELMHGM